MPSTRTISTLPPPPRSLPSSILIIGSGVFGLSTAWAFTRRPAFDAASITVVDRSPDAGVFPSRDAASVDTSRIIRGDYADPAYAALAAEALVEWRKQGPADLGGAGRYTESGLVLVADEAAPGPLTKKTGMTYVRSSWANVVALARDAPGPQPRVRELPTPAAIRDAVGTGGASGCWGYLNEGSGWADADASMRWLLARVQATGRVRFVHGTAAALHHAEGRVAGAVLDDGGRLSADLTIVSAGAWSGSLVDLSGRAVATGQVLGYLRITEEEQARLAAMPVLLNMSTGLFVIPPRGGELKVARHAYGYLNPTTSLRPLGTTASTVDGPGPTVSVPLTAATQADLTIPDEGSEALRAALREMIPLPGLHDRPFSHTRLCWYTDTPTGDFLVDHHPSFEGLFVATGGSGHAFKFLPVLGDKIVDCVEGKCPPQFRDKWAWGPEDRQTPSWDAVVTEDGTRGGGESRLLLYDELRKSRRTRED